MSNIFPRNRKVEDLAQLLTEKEVRRTMILYTIAGLIHGFLDPIITYLVINENLGRETNPLLQPLFEQSLISVFIGHLPLFVILLVCFAFLLYLFNIAEGTERDHLYWISQSVLVVCIIWGALLVGWNLNILL
jgi:hypothetical protein